MRLYFNIAIWALNLGQALAAPAFEHQIEERAPAACSSPKGVFVAYNVLSVLRASPFCTKWLAISATTVETTEVQKSTISITITSTSTVLAESITATTTVTSTTTTIPFTVEAATFTSTIPASTTVFTPTTTTTVTTTTTTSTSTTYLYDVEAKKKKRAPTAAPARIPRPPKPAALLVVADNIISSACSCLATTPTFILTRTTQTTSTLSFDELDFTTSTTLVSTSVQIDVTVLVATSFTTTTPTLLITSTATLTSPTIVATSVRTTTRTQIALGIIDVILIPIQLDGCTVIEFGAKFTNIGGSDIASAARLCAPRCIAAGRTVCGDFHIVQNLPSATWDCFLLNQAQQANTNFVCSQPNIGQAAEIIIIY